MTKFTSALAAVALIGCGTAFAANQTTSATPSSTAAPATATSSAATTPATPKTHMAQAGTSAQPSAPSATPVKKPTWKACRKQATDKGLKGKERSQFIKDCHAGKNS